MRWLISGCAGFIGTNAARYFLKGGDTVIGIDDFSSPMSRWRSDHALTQPGIQLWVDDLLTAPKYPFDSNFNGGDSPDAILHLAAQTAVTKSVEDPFNDADRNIKATIRLLEWNKEWKVPFIYASTNKVYGNGLPDKDLCKTTLRVPESLGRTARWWPSSPVWAIDSPTKRVWHDWDVDPRTPYGVSKYAGELYVHDYAETYDFPYTIFRQSCIYGPGQFGTEDQGWVAWLLWQAIKGAPVTIYGDGCQVRDLLYVEDLCQMYSVAARSNCREIVGVGGGVQNTASVREVYGYLVNQLGGTPQCSNAAWRPNDQKFYCTADSWYMNMVHTSVKDGLDKMIMWARGTGVQEPV